MLRLLTDSYGSIYTSINNFCDTRRSRTEGHSFGVIRHGYASWPLSKCTTVCGRDIQLPHLMVKGVIDTIHMVDNRQYLAYIIIPKYFFRSTVRQNKSRVSFPRPLLFCVSCRRHTASDKRRTCLLSETGVVIYFDLYVDQYGHKDFSSSDCGSAWLGWKCWKIKRLRTVVTAKKAVTFFLFSISVVVLEEVAKNDLCKFCVSVRIFYFILVIFLSQTFRTGTWTFAHL